ncbi:MAG: glycosyltransferase family 39 protein [Nitrospirota bacterium]
MTGAGATETVSSPITHHPSPVLLLLLACLLFFLGLGSLGLTDRDEGRNAEAAREMVETGDWISPTFNYEPRFAKPAFVYWLMGASYKLLGVSEFTARLPSALSGIALVLLQYGFLTRVRGPVFGLMGGLMLLLNVEILAIGHMALTDGVLILWTTLSLFGFWLGLHGEGAQRHFLWLFYAGMGLGTLTKGPIGLAVPLLAVVPYLTLVRRWKEFGRRGFPLAGTLLFLSLALPWYLAMLAIHGARYTASAQADTVSRFLGAMEGHGGTVFFYVPVLLLGFFPWSGLLPFALYDAFKSWREARGARREGESKISPRPSPLASSPPAPQELELFAALWLAAGFLFFSLSATRLPHYLGPLFPAAAILCASYWNRCLTDPATRGVRASIHLMTGLGYLLGFVLAAAPALYSSFIEQVAKEFPIAPQVDPGMGPPAAGFIFLLGSAGVAYYGLSEQRRPAAFWMAGATLALVLLMTLLVTLPRVNRYFIAPPQELAYAAGLNLESGDRLIAYGVTRPSLTFYAKRRIVFVPAGQEDQLRRHLAQPGRTMILLPSRMKPNLPAEAAGFPVILERFGYSLLANEPMVKGLPATPPVPKLGPHGPLGP